MLYSKLYFFVKLLTSRALVLFYRAISIQTLIGNVGGYIGMCLGYSLLQFPNFMLLILEKSISGTLELKHYIALEHLLSMEEKIE